MISYIVQLICAAIENLSAAGVRDDSAVLAAQLEAMNLQSQSQSGSDSVHNPTVSNPLVNQNGQQPRNPTTTAPHTRIPNGDSLLPSYILITGKTDYPHAPFVFLLHRSDALIGLCIESEAIPVVLTILNHV